MLTEAEHDAMTRWYSQERIIDEARKFLEREDYLDLEEYIHKFSLFPLGNHGSLPDFMLNEKGETLFPTNLNPMVDEDKWQDAIEVGWEVLEARLGVSHDDVHRRVADEQADEFDTFLKSVNQRKRERGEE
jgi:hypothetical protein